MMEISLNTSGPSYCESKGEQLAWEADNTAPDDKKFFQRYSESACCDVYSNSVVLCMVHTMV